MDGLPARGAAVRRLGLALPPVRMPARRGLRPLKRWRYVGVYTPELMLCVGEARVGPIPMRWWAVALPDGSLRQRTTSGRGGVHVEPGRARVEAPGATIDIRVDEGDGVETASPTGKHYIWTRKQACVPVRGTVRFASQEHRIDGAHGFVDESAGYHSRRTSWQWSAGVGTSEDGRAVGWNLVHGVHDSPENSERTLWLDGEPRELAPAAFAADLSGVGALRFSEWSAREDHTNLLLFRSDYRQPFGTFEGEVGGVRLREGYGVMEHHDVRW
jgi:Protein of unknown function (DUF2804)